MVPEEDQPEGYVQSSLFIDSETSFYSERALRYVDSQCIFEYVDDPVARVSSGEIVFDGLVTTNSGLEATVARYNSNGTSPDLVGLLYRDGDILYRDVRLSTVIEDVVPTELSLGNPWQFSN